MRSLPFAVLLAVGCASTEPVVVAPPRRPDSSLKVVPPPPKTEAPPVEDPYLWLEEVSGKKPLEWAETQNEKALAEFDSPAREALRKRLLAIFDSKEKIPVVEAKGKWLFNVWRDDQHERGLWRRVSVDGYEKKDPAWETVIDLDALAASEKENWVLGLLMGVMLTQRPDLFGASVCSVPLLAGASWMGEYGDPRIPEEWAALAKFSPYQNAKKGTKYPRVLFTTSTLDDRVHPGHAPKMVARMLEQGHDVQYFENTEGAHGGAANNAQKANLYSLEYVFLANQLTK